MIPIEAHAPSVAGPKRRTLRNLAVTAIKELDFDFCLPEEAFTAVQTSSATERVLQP